MTTSGAAPTGPRFPLFDGQVVTLWNTVNTRDMTLMEEFAFYDSTGLEWRAYKGEVINGASIPRIFWSIAGSPYTGPYRRASVLHDVYCTRRTRPSRDVHRVFYEAMLVDGEDPFDAQRMYAAVRLFGPRWDMPAPSDARASALSELRVVPFDQLEAAIDAALGEGVSRHESSVPSGAQ